MTELEQLKTDLINQKQFADEYARRFAIVSGLLTKMVNKDWKWTKDKPLVPGWYWWEYGPGAGLDIIEVDWQVGETYLVCKHGAVEFMEGRFSGPLPSPSEE